jgi:hypothetical protein
MGYRWKSVRFYPEDWRAETRDLSRLEKDLLFEICVTNWRTGRPMVLAELVWTVDDQFALGALVASGRVVRSEAGLWARVCDTMKNRTSYGRLPKLAWAAIRKRIFARDDYTCQYCGRRGGPLECDHRTPLSQGGGNEESNLVTACRPCNRTKWARTPEQMGWEV